MRLIDADRLLETLSTGGHSSVRKVISREPTIDAVEVVRCGQCQHWKINPHNLYGGYCPYSERASLDHFCSYGKGKEGANSG